MDIAPHDLLRLRNWRLLAELLPPLEWVAESLRAAPFVVVRRALPAKGYIPVGIRGRNRNERLAAFLPLGEVADRIPPKRLAAEKTRRYALQSRFLPPMQALFQVDALFSSLGVVWGPAGSVGFELASGIGTVKPSSDLDVVVYADTPFSVDWARRLLMRLERLPARTDVQVETPLGAFSLVEYAGGQMPILLRTYGGPALAEFLWPNEKLGGCDEHCVSFSGAGLPANRDAAQPAGAPHYQGNA